MAPLPLSYYEQFLTQLTQRPNVEFITYNELMWEDDVDFRHRYPAEWKRWKAALREGRRSPDKIYIVLQHDTDSGPHDTLLMADIEQRLGVRSTIMTFVQWRSESAQGELVPYPIDWQRLKELEAAGFCVGYHTNALHNAQFDITRAYEYFREELDALSQKFNVRFFSPHGGLRGPKGEVNNSLDYPDAVPSPARWIHNRFTPRFDSVYSDGGIFKRLATRDETTDLRRWMHGLRPGRHRALIHAQMYRDHEFEPYGADHRARPAWYDEFIEETEKLGLPDASQAFWSRRPQFHPMLLTMP